MGWVENTTTQPLYPLKRGPVSILQNVMWVPRPVWRGEGKLDPTGNPAADYPACSERLYGLRYPGPLSAISIFIC
jgi:hypothetical protein